MVTQDKSSDTDNRSLRLKIKFPKLRKKKLEEEDKPKSGQRVQGFIGKSPQQAWGFPGSPGTSQGPKAPFRNVYRYGWW